MQVTSDIYFEFINYIFPITLPIFTPNIDKIKAYGNHDTCYRHSRCINDIIIVRKKIAERNRYYGKKSKKVCCTFPV